ncbi:MAG: Ig-like domain-containing protein [Flavobacteriaceae bacterium]
MDFDRKIILFYFLALISSCSKDSGSDVEVESINLISVYDNSGAIINDGDENISTNLVLRLIFSKVISINSIENTFNINPSVSENNISFDYKSSNTVVEITLNLEYNTNYNISLQGNIGNNGEQLSQPFNLNFKTQVDDTIYYRPPCTSIADCKRSVMISKESVQGNFDFYSNYDIYEDKAKWENLKKAVIVIHGGSFNADDYFGHLTSTFLDLGLSNSTVLISPHFKSEAENSDDLYWRPYIYRDGKLSGSQLKISSFEVLDIIIDRLSNKEFFPVLDEIIVTGTSSGGRMTHTYAAANRSESKYSSINFEYIVSNSQYFYYPNSERINEQTNNLYSPSGCSGMNNWPFGYQNVPEYINVLDKESFDNIFINRSVTYLNGNGNYENGDINTDNCEYVLLGSTRFKRGENMFRYMNLKYNDNHNHKRVIVDGVSHNGRRMYQSSEFKSLLTQLFND